MKTHDDGFEPMWHWMNEGIHTEYTNEPLVLEELKRIGEQYDDLMKPVHYFFAVMQLLLEIGDSDSALEAMTVEDKAAIERLRNWERQLEIVLQTGGFSPSGNDTFNMGVRFGIALEGVSSRFSSALADKYRQVSKGGKTGAKSKQEEADELRVFYREEYERTCEEHPELTTKTARYEATAERIMRESTTTKVSARTIRRAVEEKNQ